MQLMLIQVGAKQRSLIIVLRLPPSWPPVLGSLISRLRREFRSGQGSINVAGLASSWLQQLLRSARQGLTGRELQALALRVAQQLQDLRVKSWIREYEVSEEEYVHSMLLLEAQDRCAAQIHTPLKVSLAKYPKMLQNLQSLFNRADSRGCAFLSQQDLARMYRERLWRLHPNCSDGRPLTDAEMEDPNGLAQQLLEDCGTRDMASLAVRQLEWLLGEGMSQIWHTGVVAFDKEYFFSSDTIFDAAGKTSFGEPSQVRSLGYTFWNQDELHDFIVTELKPIFHRDTYDVICNNCNHFSDRASDL
ncbi:unnamed protein product [Effrenium voratum]|nr:unnamed protein product [Effrenium voratum]